MQGHNLLFSMTLDVSLERIKQSLLMNFMSLKITKLTFALQFKGKKKSISFHICICDPTYIDSESYSAIWQGPGKVLRNSGDFWTS